MFALRVLRCVCCVFQTANLNNYIFTTPGGTGPAYSNMCVAVHDEATGKPEPLVGGNKYRKYTIDWHTGGVLQPDGSKSKPRVDFYGVWRLFVLFLASTCCPPSLWCDARS